MSLPSAFAAQLLDKGIAHDPVLSGVHPDQLGATVGDLLDTPQASGGLALSRYAASAVLAAFIVACIALLPQRPERVSA
ncbi:MAG: hypothetical protein ACXWCK_26025 [Burkholderiales bacterium]